jgi:hypothetical protein
MTVKMVNIAAMPGMGQYRVEDDGNAVGFIRRRKDGVYRCPTTGKEFALEQCYPVWVATTPTGRTVAVRASRADALRCLVQVA